ncbi:MAG TPA: hypothetical protein VK892_06565, partial [Pyrinomonadaceae bacterium]|nr:hypothetical protein [Pyrinomonadaceae bacterium]
TRNNTKLINFFRVSSCYFVVLVSSSLFLCKPQKDVKKENHCFPISNPTPVCALPFSLSDGFCVPSFWLSAWRRTITVVGWN